MDTATAPALSLLLVDDDAIIAESLEFILSDDYRVTLASDRNHCLRVLSQLAEPPALALVDLGLPPNTHTPDEGFAVIEHIHEHYPMTKIVVLSGQDERKFVESAQELGAVDFIAKPCDVAELKARLKQHLDAGENPAAAARETTGIIGQSQAIEMLRMQIQQLADSPYPVLIEGESGSGKELTAHYLHEYSARSEQPFLTLNCAAFNGDLLESQLFGHVRGAFTGANEDKRGFFEEVGAGTLLLDEIADLPLDLQAKLLRVLENGEFYRIGETRPRTANARVLAASNKSLLSAIGNRDFREDLYHRLSVLTLRVPSLDERGEDKVVLLDYFKHQIDSRLKGFELDDAALELWRDYNFPGNVRELRNIVIRLSAKYPGQTIKPAVLALEMSGKRSKSGEPSEQEWLNLNLHTPGFQLNEELKRVEQKYIELALQECDNNMSRAAAMLGVNRSTLYGRIERG